MNDIERLQRYHDLSKELAEAGVPEKVIKNEHIVITDPINVLINCKISAKPYVDIILKHAEGMDYEGKSTCARILAEKGLKKAVPFLLSIFKDLDNEEHVPSNIDFWIVGRALYLIDDKTSYNDILHICTVKKFGINRQMLIGTLARMKTKEAYNVLIECLSDKTVKGAAIEALGRFGDPAAIDILEKTEVKKGLMEFYAKNTALKRLRNKAENKK